MGYAEAKSIPRGAARQRCVKCREKNKHVPLFSLRSLDMAVPLFWFGFAGVPFAVSEKVSLECCCQDCIFFDTNTPVYEIRQYKTAKGRNFFAEWLENLEVKARARIARRINRFVFGLFGDFKNVGNGVMEAREVFGPGYRIYFARVGTAIVLLLCGEDKSTQKADIDRAKVCLRDYKTRDLS